MCDIKRAQVIAPTGSGKTLLEHEAVNKAIDRGNKIFVVMAPRIALVHQLLNEFWDYKTRKWTPLCVCSDTAEVNELYVGESLKRKFETIMSATVIAERIKSAMSVTGNPIVIFSTIHSAGKINEALGICKTKADLVVFDEAHNLTKELWGQWLKKFESIRQLYFTATRKINAKVDIHGNGIGRGMNNPDLFGHVIFEISPHTLINSGRIVPPRLHLVCPFEELDLSKEKNEIKSKIMMVVGGAIKHAEILEGRAARIIVFCSSAEEAHDMAESQAIKAALPGWYLEAVTSIYRMGKKKRKVIFNDFSKSERSILFHYDVISEGIDLPGASAILPLRELGEIKIVQAIGRVLRICAADRKALVDKKIKIGESNNWEKPYGWVILPYFDKEIFGFLDTVKEYVYAIRSAKFNYDVEQMTVIEFAKGGRKTPEDNLSPMLEVNGKDFDLFEALSKIEEKVKNDIEAEEDVYKNKAIPVFAVEPGVFDRWEDAA